MNNQVNLNTDRELKTDRDGSAIMGRTLDLETTSAIHYLALGIRDLANRCGGQIESDSLQLREIATACSTIASDMEKRTIEERRSVVLKQMKGEQVEPKAIVFRERDAQRIHASFREIMVRLGCIDHDGPAEREDMNTMDYMANDACQQLERGTVLLRDYGGRALQAKEYPSFKWCECGGKSTIGSYPHDGECDCGIYRHHIHCGVCERVSQVG